MRTQLWRRSLIAKVHLSSRTFGAQALGVLALALWARERLRGCGEAHALHASEAGQSVCEQYALKAEASCGSTLLPATGSQHPQVNSHPGGTSPHNYRLQQPGHSVRIRKRMYE